MRSAHAWEAGCHRYYPIEPSQFSSSTFSNVINHCRTISSTRIKTCRKSARSPIFVGIIECLPIHDTRRNENEIGRKRRGDRILWPGFPSSQPPSRGPELLPRHADEATIEISRVPGLVRVYIYIYVRDKIIVRASWSAPSRKESTKLVIQYFFLMTNNFNILVSNC